MKVVYMCHPEFENGGLREWPLTENGVFQSGPSLKNEGDFETESNKEKYIFEKGSILEQPRSEKWNKQMYILKRGVFWSCPGKKSGGFRSGPGKTMGGFQAAHTHTALISEYPTSPPPGPSSYTLTSAMETTTTPSSELVWVEMRHYKKVIHVAQRYY